MTQQESQKTNDTFGFYTQQIKQIQEKPFKKLAFLGLAWGIGMGLSFGLVYGSFQSYNLSSKNDHALFMAQQQKIEQSNLDAQKENMNNILAKKTDLFNQIKSITPDQFSQFMVYIEKQQSLYDSRISMVREGLIEAQVKDRAHSLDGLTESQKLSDLLSLYKSNYDNEILKMQKIYKTPMSNVKNVDIKDMNTFIEFYANYQAGIPVRNMAIEKQLHSYIYAKNKANVDYNLSHQVVEQDKTLEKELINDIKVNKPKM